MKKIITLLLFLCLTLPLFGFTLKGSVTYTVEQARKEAFANVEYTLPKHIINANRTDPNYKQNQSLIKNGIKETGDRYITYFSDGTYGIIYKDNLYYEFSYNNKGGLTSVGKRSSLVCPTKTYRYDTNQKLDSVTLYLTLEDVYVFDPDGKFVAHWIGDKCYDINNQLILESY